MNKRVSYNNTPYEIRCCQQCFPVLFSSPEKNRTGNENALHIGIEHLADTDFLTNMMTYDKTKTTDSKIYPQPHGNTKFSSPKPEKAHIIIGIIVTIISL